MDDPVRPDVPPEGRRDPRVFAPERISTDHPPLLGWAAAGVIVVVLLIAKPWGGGVAGDQGPAEASARVDAVVAAAPDPARPVPSPSRMDTAGPEVADFCLDPGIWLIATIEGSGDRARRVWRALPTTPVADGPTDPSIPDTTIETEGVRALGWCAPVVGSGRPSWPARIDIWRIDDGIAKAVQLAVIRPTGGPSPFGAIYAPPTSADVPARTGEPAWPDGRLVFRYTSGPMIRWFAVDVSSRPLPTGSALPSAPS